MLEIDIIDGVSRLLATDASDFITLQPGQLRNHEAGLWSLEGDDTIEGSNDAEFIISNQGQDRVFGNGGDDTIMGGRGNDFINGGPGNDFLRGDRDSDVVEGGDGDDIIFGGKEQDRLLGGDGNDFVSGDLGNDTLTGTNGDDTLIGGEGQDRFVINRGLGIDLITDFEIGIDIIELPSGLGIDDLEITNNSRNQAQISLRQTGEVMAVLNGIPASLLTEADFDGVSPSRPDISVPPTGGLTLTPPDQELPGLPTDPPLPESINVPDPEQLPQSHRQKKSRHRNCLHFPALHQNPPMQ